MALKALIIPIGFIGFSKLSAQLNDTINKIANLEITNNINLSGKVEIDVLDQQAIDDIINTIAQSVAQSTNGKLKRALRNFKDKLDNQAG